jgi:hypothetical protein
MAQFHLALKTLTAIETAIAADQGAKFRTFLGQVIPHMKDAYRGEDEGFRSHLGASVIGKTCGRHIWYGWRWAHKPKFSGRMLRLFNRGHLEEARFIACLLTIGVQVYQQDENGNQFRISELGGHLGGSGDGIGVAIPDLPPNTPCLLEFKTHNDKSFKKLQKEGVRSAKFEHYVQMCSYLKKMGLTYALYGAVNKNDDELHLEIIVLDPNIADQFLDRGRKIIMMRKAPERLPNASPGLFDCRYCDELDICHHNKPMERNCRTCLHSEPREDGTWWCESKKRQMDMLFPSCKPENASDGETFQLSKERQLIGCQDFYEPI